MHQYSYQFLSCLFSKNNCFSDWKENTVFQNKENTKSLVKLDIPSDECGCGMVFIIFIFIHFAFWMGQQPSFPEESSQVLVPSGHLYFSSGEETSPEVPMKALLFIAVSICCVGILLPAFKFISAVPSRQRLPVLLTSTAAGSRNTDEFVFGGGRMHSPVVVLHIYP